MVAMPLICFIATLWWRGAYCYVEGKGWVSLLSSKVSCSRDNVFNLRGTRAFSLGDSRSRWVGVLFCTSVSQESK